MSEKLKLPKGWEIKTIGDVCISASSNISQNKLENEKGNYPIYGASGLIKKVSFYHRDKPYLSIVKDGSGVGRVTKMDAYTSVIGTLQYILPKENIDLDYLNYSLMCVDFKKYVAGAAIPHIYFKDYKNEPFLWMPLKEQKRIVSILDEAFAAIAKAKANAEQNLKNAKELFESYLQGVFEKKSNGWEEKTLGEVCDIGDGNYSSKYPKASEFVKSGVPFLTATNLKNGTIIPDGIRYISKEQHLTLTKGHIIQGDLVIVVRGSSTGNNSIVPSSYAGSNLNSQLAFLRVKDKTYLDSNYLFAVFNSPLVMKKVKSEISGAAQPQLPNNKLLDISVNIPLLKEQQTIVRQLDALRAETKKLEAVYQKKIDDLEELKKSILQKAFTGELKTE